MFIFLYFYRFAHNKTMLNNIFFIKNGKFLKKNLAKYSKDKFWLLNTLNIQNQKELKSISLCFLNVKLNTLYVITS